MSELKQVFGRQSKENDYEKASLKFSNVLLDDLIVIATTMDYKNENEEEKLKDELIRLSNFFKNEIDPTFFKNINEKNFVEYIHSIFTQAIV